METQFNNPIFSNANPKFNGLDLSTLRQAGKENQATSADRSSHDPVRLLETQLSKTLPGFAPLNQLNAADFAPLQVANRIVNFVETAISQRAESDLEAQNMLQQAREGIAKGFTEARGILSSMPQMSDAIDAQINETESLINQRLDDLDNVSIDSPRQQQIDRLISESATFSSRYKQSSQATIEIITQQGDKVQVSYSAFIQAASEQNTNANQQGISASYEFSAASSVEYQFSVLGNLDAGEQKAINELLNDVGNLASQFFSGDVQAAFNSAMQLGFDSGELKSFAVDFQQSTRVEQMQSYQRTEQIAGPVTMPVEPGPAIDLLGQLQGLIEQAKESAIVQQPENTIKSLLSDMLALINQDMNLSLKEYVNKAIENA